MAFISLTRASYQHRLISLTSDGNRDVKVKLFRGFADKSRFGVLETLRKGPRCVSELIRATGLSQSNLSMHLACLRECGLVRARRNGRFVHYELADQSVSQLLKAADQVLTRVAKRIEVCPRYEVRERNRGKRTSPKR